MHLPELVLGPRRLRGFGGQFGIRMDSGQREMPKHKAKLVAHLSLPRWIRWVRQAADGNS